MIDKATTAVVAAKRQRWGATAALAFVVVFTVVVIKAGAPYLFQGATVRSEFAKQIRETTGLVVTTSNQGRFDLLPRPRIVMKGLHFADPSGALTIDADALEGDVRLLPLMVGRLELSAATLLGPKLVIDLDGQPMKPDSMIGRALHAGALATSDGRRLGVVTLVDGTAIVRSKALGWTPMFSALDVTVDWPDIDAPAILSGSLVLKDTPADVSLWLAQPSSLMRGETSPLSLRIQSTPVDLSATGDVSSTAAPAFHGHVALRAPSLPVLVALTGARIAPPAPFADVAVNGDVTIGTDREGRSLVDLAALRLRLDGNDYEGTLAYQGGAAPSLSGTLATDQLVLAPFLARAPKLFGPARDWSTARLPPPPSDPVGLDLRVSATHLRAAPFTIDDAALSVMTRNDRTEIALVEGKAYGGDVKGRASIGFASGEFALRAAGSLTGADAAALSWDAFGRQLATGTVSGSAAIDATGDTPEALMRHLQGWAKARASGGEISGVDIARGLRAGDGGRPDAMLSAMRAGQTTFHTLALSARLADGVATIEDGSLVGQDATVRVEGAADIGDRILDLGLVAAIPAGGARASRSLPFSIDGTFDKIVVKPSRTPTAIAR